MIELQVNVIGILLDGLAGTSTEPSPANFSVDPLGEFSTRYPPVWTPSSVPDQDYSMVDVPASTQAFQKVHSLFHKTLSETRVEIASARSRMSSTGTSSKGRRSTYGSAVTPRKTGLWRVNGFVYGYGSYSNTFAVVSLDAGVRHMFLAKVLVGKNLYDTCVDQLVNPTIFVVFDRGQCYPYYLIKYKELLVVNVNE
ncbi:protein mono-ADP-ribosyltransferase PARP11-like [Salvelinus alpinus]